MNRGQALYDIINSTLEEYGVELTSWMIATVVDNIEDYLGREND